MSSTLRVIVEAPDAETAEAVKEQFFKQLYEHAGTKVTFELPADGDASEITAFAEGKDCKVSTEEHADELDDAAPVDFW